MTQAITSDIAPRLSVVVASHNGARSAARCIAEIERQRSSGVREIIVIDNSVDGSAEMIRRDFPEVTLVAAGQDKLIPELWGIGVEHSSGEIVALTTSHFIPAADWVTEIISAHENGDAGVGGAIENDEHSGLVSWGVYFCRYTPYMLPFAAANVDDFAADNASYKRTELEKVRESMAGGFWEAFIHKDMRKAGMTLIKTPRIVVYHQRSFGFGAFMNQRFWHGRQFGAARAARLGTLKRVALAVLSPLIPFVYLARIARRVAKKKRNGGPFLLSLPVLFMFLTSWALGEFSGYVSGRE